MVRKLCLAILRGDSLFGKTLILVALIILVSACGPAKTVVPFTATFLPPSPTAPPPTFTVTPTDTLIPPSQVILSAETADQIVQLHTLSGHSSRVIDLAFSGNGAYVASSSLDRMIKLWDVVSWQELHAFTMNKVGFNGIAFSPDGSLLASADAIWDVESRQVVHELERGRNVPGPVALSPDGSTLAVALENQPIKLWDVANGQVLRTFEEQPDDVTFSIAFSPDGALLAAGVHGGKVRLWDTASGQVAGTLEHGNEDDDVHDVAFSPDGKLLASGGTAYAVRIWDVASGQTIHTLRYGDGLYGLAFSPDGGLLATAGCDRTVKLWNVATGRLVRSLSHGDEVMSVVFSPDGTLLASGGYDQVVYLWGIPSVVTPTPPPAFAAHWSVQALTPGYPLHTIEVAGTYEQIGYALGRWYQDRGFLPRPLTTDEQKVARELLRFYDEVHPAILAQLRGLYAAYGLSLGDLQQAIPVSDNDGVRVLLPGLVENGSCSVVFTRPAMAADGHARLGRNYDWPGAAPDTYLVFTQPEGGYATVVMTAHTPGLSAADGLNSRGLALGFASVRDVGYEPPAGPALISGFAYRLILETCANVEEAIALLRSVPITFIKSKPDDPITHLLLADRSGASAAVEFLPEGIVVSRSDAPYQVMTNSHWAGPADQPDCPRYQTVVERLEKAQGRIGMEGLMAVMASVHSSTQWTTLYDLEDLSLVLTLPGVDPSTHYEFSLAEFVARMESTR